MLYKQNRASAPRKKKRSLRFAQQMKPPWLILKILRLRKGHIHTHFRSILAWDRMSACLWCTLRPQTSLLPVLVCVGLPLAFVIFPGSAYPLLLFLYFLVVHNLHIPTYIWQRTSNYFYLLFPTRYWSQRSTPPTAVVSASSHTAWRQVAVGTW